MQLEWTNRARADQARIFEFNLGWSYDWAVRVDDRLIERAKRLTRKPRLGRPGGSPNVYLLSIPDIQYVMEFELGEDRVRVLTIQSTREVR